MKKEILAIIGSASAASSNLKLIDYLANQSQLQFRITIFDGLKSLPHFDADLSLQNTPNSILEFREAIAKADGIIICTPEYIFSIPSGLKNAIEWCVSTTVFSNKPLGIITASAHGVKGHEELQMIMRTVEAHFTDDTCLLIQGIKSKVNQAGEITNEQTKKELLQFMEALTKLVNI